MHKSVIALALTAGVSLLSLPAASAPIAISDTPSQSGKYARIPVVFSRLRRPRNVVLFTVTNIPALFRERSTNVAQCSSNVP